MSDEMDKRLDAIFARMATAGWCHAARDDKSFAINWTDKGKERAKQLGALLRELNAAEMDGIDLYALADIIENMSPGGSDTSRNALD